MPAKSVTFNMKKLVGTLINTNIVTVLVNDVKMHNIVLFFLFRSSTLQFVIIFLTLIYTAYMVIYFCLSILIKGSLLSVVIIGLIKMHFSIVPIKHN